MNRKPYKANSLKGAQTYVRCLIKQRSELTALLERYHSDRLMLAKLASKTPQFFNPLEAMAAETLRDQVIGRPDSSTSTPANGGA